MTPPPQAHAVLTTLGASAPRTAPASDLGWNQTPRDLDLWILTLPHGTSVWLHPRRGAWSVFHTDIDPRPTLAGVHADALVFGIPGTLPAALEDLLQPTLQPLPALRDPFAGTAQWDPDLQLGQWGPFPHAAPDDATQRLLAQPNVTTAIAHGIPARVGDPHHLLVAHRPPMD